MKTNEELIRFCQNHDILVEAYFPNEAGKLMDKPDIIIMTTEYKVSVPQLSIRYDIQLGLLLLPKSIHKEYMWQNADVDFMISTSNMNILKQIPEYRFAA